MSQKNLCNFVGRHLQDRKKEQNGSQSIMMIFIKQTVQYLSSLVKKQLPIMGIQLQKQQMIAKAQTLSQQSASKKWCLSQMSIWKMRNYKEDIIRGPNHLVCLKIFIHNRQGRYFRNFMVDLQYFFILTSKTIYNERLIIEIKPIFTPKQSLQIFILYNNSKLMITTKLKKGGTAKSLFIQFSAKPLPFVFSQFLSICKEQGVYIKLEDIPHNQARIYLAHSQKTVQMKGIKLENLPSNFQSVLNVIYLNCDEDEKLLQGIPPLRRTLLIREGLQTKFYIDYQFQNTQSQNQSIVYLCQLSSMIINSRLEGDIDFFDQKSQEIKSISEQTIKEMLWKNIFYQIPGLGKEKCILITQKYPSYESLLQDFLGAKQLKNLPVSHGTKEIKLGNVLANRIYRCLLEQNGQLSIHEQ